MRTNSFLSNTRGGLIIMFALLLPVLCMCVGIAVDYANAVRAQNKLAVAVDTGLLAVAKVELNGTDRRTLFNKTIMAQLQSESIDIELSNISLVVEETLNSVDVTAVVPAVVNNTIMDGFGFPTNRIGINASASHAVTNIEISLVLDISSSMKGKKLEDLKEATKLFLDTVMFTDGQPDDRVTVSIIPYGGSVRLPADVRATVPLNTSGMPFFEFESWSGCVQYKTSDFDDGGLSDVTHKPIPQHWKWNNGNWWCPKPGNEFVPQTTDYDRLVALVDGFQLSDGTGSDHGILWGYKMLSPYWHDRIAGGEPGRPVDFDDETTLKVLVVMTDGGITAQFTPNPSLLLSSQPPFKTKNNADYSKNVARSNFDSICNQSKGNNVTVYTIGFAVKNNTQLQDLQNCATSLAHYFTPDSNELQQTFKTIAASLSVPRLTH